MVPADEGAEVTSTRSPSTRFRPPKLRSGPSFAVALKLMREGKLLTLEYYQGKPRWEVGGQSIAAEVVSLLLACRAVESNDAALLPDTPSQSWRLGQSAVVNWNNFEPVKPGE